MRIREILSEKGEIEPIIDPKKLAKAGAEGFDTTQVWYHGTKRKFTKFRSPNGKGVDELGKGVYVTKFIGTANVWAQGPGQVLACVLRKGKLIEMSDMPQSGLWHEGNKGHDLWQEVYRGYQIYGKDQQDAMDNDEGYQEFIAKHPHMRHSNKHEDAGYAAFAERYSKGQISLGECLSRVGYIGATSRYSQIRGQAVVWNPDDVRIVGRAPGFDGFVDD